MALRYYVLLNQMDGALIRVSSDPIDPEPGQQVILRAGDMPDLERNYWHPGSMAFIEKNTSRIITKLAFMRRFTNTERVAIYSAEKNDINVSVWMDMFRLAQEINLDDPDLVQGIQLFELAGIIGQGRSAEVLA